MRMFLATALTLASTTGATTFASEEYDAKVAPETEEAAEGELEAIGWNRWRCLAREQGIWWSRTYVGYSQYFQQGSGEGVQGQNIARLIAERECEFNQARRTWGQRGFCQVDTCQVDRF